MTTKYFEQYNPDSGQIYTRNDEAGKALPLKKAFFQVSTNATISFETTGGDVVSGVAILAGVEYEIEIKKITASTQVIYIRHNGEVELFKAETTPGTQASVITFANVAADQMDVDWTDGSGIGRILVCKEGGAVDANPTDGVTYTGDLNFGDGDEIGTGNFVVAVRENFDGAAVTITGLTTATTYHFQVFEYRGRAGYEKYKTTTATDNPNSQITA